MRPLTCCSSCSAEVAATAAFCGACGRPHDAGLVGRVIAERYRVLGFVGAGGMGRVYRAEHVALEREVALKVLAPEYAGDRDLLERFRREAVATSRLAHPNVVAALDFGVTDGLAFFVMEWLPGLGLDEVLARSGPMAPVRALHLAQQAAAALGAAHARRIVHRDVKPGNLMVMPGDLIKVVDFGLAQLRDRAGRLTDAGRAMGTPAYLAPEQVTGAAVGPAADVYALGGVLYELLVGEPPVGRGDPLTLIHRQLAQVATAPSAARPELRVAGLDELVAQLLAKDPLVRPADGGAAADAIAAVLARLTGPTLARPLAEQRRAVVVIAGGDDDGLAQDAAAIVTAAGGTLARAVGDELFAHFPSSELAVLAAIAASERHGGALRVAVHEGEVAVGAGGGLFGTTVNHALRIARLAPPGAVVVTEPAALSAGLAVASLLAPHGAIHLGPRAPALGLRIAQPRAATDPAIAVIGRVAPGAVEFTCGCGAVGQIAATGAARWVARCGQCSQPWIVNVSDPEEVAAPRPAPTGALDAIRVAPRSDSADHLILAALANLE